MTAEQRTRISFDVRGVSKTFGGAHALRDAALSVRRGTVHALLGGNGSGKSTLIKSIAGVYTADSGELQIGGTSVALAQMTPAASRDLGFRFVHQDLGLFPQLSIAENIAITRGYPTRWATVRDRALNRSVQELLDRFHIDARADTEAGALRPSQRAMVAIARALDDADAAESILLLDEPTATLGEHDARDLLAAIRRRADDGQTVVIVSHRFDEITAVADDVTVFRDGHNVGTAPVPEMPLPRVVNMMTGETGGELPASFVNHQLGEPILSVADLSAGRCAAASFEVSAGEILGLIGLDGAGQGDVVTALFGAVPSSGQITLEGASYRPKSPREAMQAGVALVPPDRLADAAFLDLPVAHNVSVTVLDRLMRGLFLSSRRERATVEASRRAYEIRAPRMDAPLSVLSGGNQQKVVLGRWLQRHPRLILLAEPTQGVDVVARSDIYRSIAASAANGAAVVVTSSDLEELLMLTHRIAVFRDGRLVEIRPTASTTRNEIAHLVMEEESPAS